MACQAQLSDVFMPELRLTHLDPRSGLSLYWENTFKPVIIANPQQHKPIAPLLIISIPSLAM
jgi:hypothetical protein